jgi:serine protease Do
VVTNHHVAGHAIRLFCTLSDKREIEADLIGTDPLADIAVIKLKGEPGKTFPVADFGDSSQVKVGDYVLAMGSPLALSQSVTLGIVSNTELVMPEFFDPMSRFTLDGEDVGSMVLWIGHDAAIYGGNSGGPLVNLEGAIVGINEIDFGLGGAIPGNLAKDVSQQLIRSGKVTRGWLGVEVQPQLKFSGEQGGILVTGVIGGTPAARAGFKTGDRLIRLAGQPVEVRFKEQVPVFNRVVAGLAPGTEVEAVVMREDSEVPLKVTPGDREEIKPKNSESKEWGITVSNLSFVASKEMKRDSQEGVLITSVRPGGPSGEAKPAIRKSDVLVSANGEPLMNVKDLDVFTSKVTEGKKQLVPVVAEFERENNKFMTVVKVGVRETEDPGLEVKKPWLPIATQVLTSDLAEKLGVAGKKGVRITKVYPHPAVSESGLAVGDLILALDGKEIPASEPEHGEVFSTMIRQYKIGATPELSIQRGKEELKIQVQLPASPKLPREMKKYVDRRFEFTARDIAFLDKAESDWSPDQTGALVTEVVPGGWAAVGNLLVNDLILEVNGKQIVDAGSLEARLKEMVEEKPKSVAFLARRGIHQRYLEIEPDWNRVNN